MDDDVLLYIEGRPFPDALRSAAEMKWSGIMRAVKGEDQVGVVVMRDGHIAWAVSNSQTENFGSFLERIGMVPKERLNEVVEKYRSLGKSKKLGSLLEEAGLISRATLRECLRAHVAAALSSMAGDLRIRLLARNGEMAVDAGLIFMISEVMPDFSAEVETEMPPAPEPQSETPHAGAVLEDQGSEILKGLSSLSGYQYSFVADMQGKVLAAHAADEVTMHAERVVPTAVAWINSSMLSSAEMAMGKVLFSFIQYESGSLFAQLADDDCRSYLAVSLDERGRLGVVMHKVSEIMPLVRNFTREFRAGCEPASQF
ncbi:MAG: hypothetical protein VB050_00030 [Geobacteraceae bacterium]|nr:hypothetical protein [Geobacteraceae bacterium]